MNDNKMTIDIKNFQSDVFIELDNVIVSGRLGRAFERFPRPLSALTPVGKLNGFYKDLRDTHFSKTKEITQDPKFVSQFCREFGKYKVVGDFNDLLRAKIIRVTTEILLTNANRKRFGIDADVGLFAFVALTILVNGPSGYCPKVRLIKTQPLAYQKDLKSRVFSNYKSGISRKYDLVEGRARSANSAKDTGIVGTPFRRLRRKLAEKLAEASLNSQAFNKAYDRAKAFAKTAEVSDLLRDRLSRLAVANMFRDEMIAEIVVIVVDDLAETETFKKLEFIDEFRKIQFLAMVVNVILRSELAEHVEAGQSEVTAASDPDNDDGTETDQLYDCALEAITKGDFANAITLLDEVIRQNGDYYEAYVCRAECNWRLSKVADAIEDVTAALDINGDCLEALFNRGMYFTETDEFEPAIADLTKALALYGDDAETLDIRGTAYYHLGNLEAAIADLDRSIELNPADAVAYYHRALAHYQSDELPDRALADLSRSIELDRSYSQAYAARAEILSELGNDTLADLDKKIAENLGISFDDENL